MVDCAPQTKVLAVAGGSAQGKSVLAWYLKEKLEEVGDTAEVLSADWFYKNPTNPKAVKLFYPVSKDNPEKIHSLMEATDQELTLMANQHGITFEELKVVQDMACGRHNWSHPGAVDMDAMCDIIEGIKAGKPMTFNEFSFTTKLRDGQAHSFHQPHYLIVEGVFALTAVALNGPRCVENGGYDVKIAIGMADYYEKGLQRAIERNLREGRRAAGDEHEKLLAIEADWKRSYAEFDNYIKPFVERDGRPLPGITMIRNDGSLEDFKRNISDAFGSIMSSVP